ncbi:MAG: TrkA family potassium uptake protein [Armatimonadota bacterium]
MYVIIAGGGKVGQYLTKALLAEGHEVLLIEQDRREIDRLTEDLGEVVMRGDGSEMRTMKDAGMERADVVVAVTGDDGDNLVISQLAKRKFDVPRVIARVNNPKNEELFHRLGVDQTVVSTKIIFNLIEQQIETDQVIPIAALKRGNIEIVEIDLSSDSKVKGITVGMLDLPEDTLIISVIRGDHAIIPHADTMLKSDDSVIAMVKANQEVQLRQVFASNNQK